MGMIPSGILKTVAYVFAKEAPRAYGQFMSDAGAEKISGIVNGHAIAAAAASLAAGWIPGAGGTAALFASVGFIWAMYYRINAASGIKLSKNAVKSLASAILTNIVTQVAGVLAGAVVVSVISLIPGIGTLTAEVIMAAIVYATVVAAGIVYLKMMTNLFKASVDIDSMSDSELKASAKEAANQTDLSGVVKEARKSYRNAKKTGAVSGNESVDMEGFN